MSINIITINDYKTRYPDSALSGIRDARIQSAINLAFSYLDVKTGCAISTRWNIVEPAAGYLTAEQKGYVTEAMYVETQYIISNNMDFSQGAEQTSFGSLSVSSSRPSRKEVCDAALLYLQKAGLYDYLQFSSLSYAGSGNVGGSISTCGEIDPTETFITETTADARYVHKNQGQEYAGKFLAVGDNGNVILTDTTLDPLMYYTRTQVNEKLLPLQQCCNQIKLGYLKSISRNTITQTITITDSNGNVITFPYGGTGGGGTGGTIVDVTVNGVSVVDSEHIAQIDLTTYALKSELTSLIDDATTVANKTWSSTKIQSMLDTLAGIVNVQVVEEVPTTPVNNTMYYIHISGTNYAIRLYANDTWTDMGTTQLDLANFVTTDTDQTISGNKSFTGKVHSTNGYEVGGRSYVKYSINTATPRIVVGNDRDEFNIDFPHTAGTVALTSDIPSHDNFVTTNTTQTITATKTFDNGSSTNAVSGAGVSINDTTHTTEYANGTIGYDTYRLTIPNKTGTIAVTSDIPTIPTNYVTTDTQQDITAIKTFPVSSSTFYPIKIKYTETDYLRFGLENIHRYLNSEEYTYTYPHKSGTFAMLSDIPSSPTNMVTTDTAQTITGYKKFERSEEAGPFDTTFGVLDYTYKNTTLDYTYTTVLLNNKIYAKKTSGDTTLYEYYYTFPSATGTLALTSDILQSNWNQTNTSAKDYIKNKPTLATVATSGSYNDLTNKPTIPTVDNFYTKTETNNLLQSFYDGIYPVGSVYFGIQAPTVPSGINATWALNTTYNGKALWVDTTKTAGSSIAQALPKPTLTFTGTSATTSSNGDHTHTFTGTSATTSESGAHTHSSGKGWVNVGSTGKSAIARDGGADYWNETSSAGAHTHTVTVAGTNDTTGAHTHTVTAKGNVTCNTAGAYGTGTVVQPPAVAISCWIRTA